ncbi:MAG: hypothetical protein IT158_30330 [Bryobacterales bacterium]|nr:hypothetical protein [Bryobacterales bacterium]
MDQPSRRRFPETAAVVPATVVRGPAANPAVTAGLIGAGGRGTYGAALPAERTTAKLAAVYDIVPERIELRSRTTRSCRPPGRRTFTRLFNTAAFGRPSPGTFGNAPKDVLRGPGINDWDVSPFKNFPPGAAARPLQLRRELYNAWNPTQFYSVDTSARLAPGGQQANNRSGSLTATRNERQMQLALRLVF